MLRFCAGDIVVVREVWYLQLCNVYNLRVNVSYWNNGVGDVKMQGDLMEDLYVYDDMMHLQHAVRVRDISRSMQRTDVATFASDVERSIRFIFERD